METEFVLSLGEQQWTLPAGADTFTIGRASNADIRLQADDQISRIHARLTRDGTTWTLNDESRNGTGLNGRRITAPTPLSNGDRIHIGRSVLTFHKSTVPDATPYIPSTPEPDFPAAPASPASAPPAPAVPAPGEPAPAVPAPGEPGPADRAPAGHARTDPAPAGPPPWDPASADPAPAGPLGDPGSADRARTGPPGDPGFADRAPASHARTGPAPAGPGPTPVGPPPADLGPGSSGTSPEYDYSPADERAAYADEYEAPYEPDEPAAHAAGEGGTWAAYPSADNPEPVRTPWEISAQVDQSEANWNRSDSWPDAGRGSLTDRPLPAPDRRTTGTDRRTPEVGRPLPRQEEHVGADQLVGSDPSANHGDESDAVGTVRLPRVLAVAAGVIALGLIGNLIVAFLANGPGGALRWLVPPGIALVVAMVLVLLDAAAPKYHRPGRFDVSVVVAIVVVLLGVGVGGFVLTAGVEYVGGYLTGNETGEDRLIKPVAKTTSAMTFTVENVTYTSHFTRVEVMLANGAKQPVTIPIAGTTFTAADGTALHADTGRSGWPSRVAAGGTEHGTITFKGHLPDSANTAVLTFKSGNIAVALPVNLTN